MGHLSLEGNTNPPTNNRWQDCLIYALFPPWWPYFLHHTDHVMFVMVHCQTGTDEPHLSLTKSWRRPVPTSPCVNGWKWKTLYTFIARIVLGLCNASEALDVPLNHTFSTSLPLANVPNSALEFNYSLGGRNSAFYIYPFGHFSAIFHLPTGVFFQGFRSQYM